MTVLAIGRASNGICRRLRGPGEGLRALRVLGIDRPPFRHARGEMIVLGRYSIWTLWPGSFVPDIHTGRDGGRSNTARNLVQEAPGFGFSCGPWNGPGVLLSSREPVVCPGVPSSGVSGLGVLSLSQIRNGGGIVLVGSQLRPSFQGGLPTCGIRCSKGNAPSVSGYASRKSQLALETEPPTDHQHSLR